ncbi:MAG: NAD(P)/FAD-dependent oxidoreductase [Clostridia bacterium]|nr:NAD(P)/FAD-dependent oxidoreductase [Clostridia bacterium]
MRYDYDVIVIGAGNGGLAAASKLSAAGLKTVVLEKHNLPGGVATSFVRGRFEFEASLHELCDVGTEEEPRLVRNLFAGLGSDAAFVNEKNLFRTVVTGPDGYDVTLESGEDFEKSLVKACPGCEKSIAKLKKVLANTSEALEYNDAKNGNPNKLVMLMRYGKFLISAAHSLDDVLRSLGFDRRTRNVLETYWSYLGVPADELNSMHYWEMARGYINGGAGIPTMKSYGLSLSLADTILKNGGEIRYNTEVTGLIFDENGRVAGVKAGSDEFFAKETVSNVIPHSVFAMDGRERLPSKDKKLLNARRLGLSFVCIYAGLDRSAAELGLNDYSVFVAHNSSTRRQYENTGKTIGMYVANCLNVAVPDATPAGTCSLFITVPVFPKSGIFDGVDAANYKKFKSDFSRKYIADFEKTLGIELLPYIEEISVATPATFARYFGAPNGTAYGYELSAWDGVLSRTLNRSNELNVPGLTFCGGHSVNGDGFGVTYTSGVEAAETVISRPAAAGISRPAATGISGPAATGISRPAAAPDTLVAKNGGAHEN